MSKSKTAEESVITIIFETIGKIIGLILVLAMLAVIVMWAWNSLVVSPDFTYWQSVLLLLGVKAISITWFSSRPNTPTTNINMVNQDDR